MSKRTKNLLTLKSVQTLKKASVLGVGAISLMAANGVLADEVVQVEVADTNQVIANDVVTIDVESVTVDTTAVAETEVVAEITSTVETIVETETETVVETNEENVEVETVENVEDVEEVLEIVSSEEETTIEITVDETSGEVNESTTSTEEAIATVLAATTATETESYSIVLDGSTATSDSSDVVVDETEGTITIYAGGTYIVSGESEGLSIVIDSTVTDDIYLVLNDAILAAGNAAILSNSKNNTVYLIVPEGTTSVLSDSETNANKGVIQVKGNLVVEGSGSLVVNASGTSAHGIKTSGTLDITDTTLNITSAYKDGIHTDATVTIDNADITITTLAGDGIQVEDEDNTGDANQGNLIINSGTVTITSDGQSLQATATVTINGGTINLTSLGSEGIEGRYVIINGGAVTIDAYDDGINATDWTTKSSYIEDGGTLSNGYTTSDMGIEIHGGTVYVVVGGDGLDSNGYILIDGGTTVVYSTGSSDASSSALDHDGTATINGGTAWFISRYNGMIETFDGGSQAYIVANTSGNANSTITISSGNETIDSLVASQAYSSIIYSGEELVSGSTYTVNGTSATATTSRQSTFGPGGQAGFPGGFGNETFGRENGQPTPPTGDFTPNQGGFPGQFTADGEQLTSPEGFEFSSENGQPTPPNEQRTGQSVDFNFNGQEFTSVLFNSTSDSVTSTTSETPVSLPTGATSATTIENTSTSTVSTTSEVSVSLPTEVVNSSSSQVNTGATSSETVSEVTSASATNSNSIAVDTSETSETKSEVSSTTSEAAEEQVENVDDASTKADLKMAKEVDQKETIENIVSKAYSKSKKTTTQYGDSNYGQSTKSPIKSKSASSKTSQSSTTRSSLPNTGDASAMTFLDSGLLASMAGVFGLKKRK